MKTTGKQGLLERLLGSPRITEALAEVEAEDRAEVAERRRGLLVALEAARAELAEATSEGNQAIAKAEREAAKVREVLEAALRATHRARLAAAVAVQPLRARCSTLEAELLGSAPPALEEARNALAEEVDRLRKIRPDTRMEFKGYDHGDRASKPVYITVSNLGDINEALRLTVEAARALEAARLTCASGEEAADLVARLRAGIPVVEPPSLPGEAVN